MLRRYLLPSVVTLLLGAFGAGASAQARADGITIVPADFTLSGPAARQMLLVQRVEGGKFRGEISDGLDLASGNPAVVRIEPDHTAVPVADGEATITAKVGTLKSSIKV